MITIKGKEYRNLQEQVQKNMDDIDEIKNEIEEGYTAGTGIDIEDKIISVDNTVAMKSDIPTKTSDLTNDEGFITIADVPVPTAGTGININNGQISVDNTVAMKTDLNYNNLSNKPDLSIYAKLNDDTQTITASSITVTPGSGYIHTTYGPSAISMSIPRTPGYTLSLPTKDGILATISDIPAAVSGINNGTNWTSITIGNDTYGIPTGGSGSIVAGTGIDITNGVVSVDSDTVITKDANNNVDGVLQVGQISSEDWDEDDDCKADIYLASGLRKSQITLQTSGEETGSSIVLKGTTALDSEGEITLYGKTTFVTDNRITVKDNDNTSTESVAYLSDITTISGGTGINVSNGVVSVNNTVAMKTDIPTISGGTGINVSNNVVSVDNTVAMKTDIPAQTKLYAHNINLDITYSGSNRIVGKASFVSTSSTQITSFTSFKNEVQTRGVVVASGIYTGSSSANNGRITCFSYGQGSYSQLCATVVYDYTDILDVVSVSSSTITDTVTQI